MRDKLADYYTITCPACKVTINVPYFKELKPMTQEQMDEEITEMLIEILEGRGYFDKEGK